MAIICPWSELEQIVFTEKKGNIENVQQFFELHSKSPDFWKTVFSKSNNQVADKKHARESETKQHEEEINKIQERAAKKDVVDSTNDFLECQDNRLQTTLSQNDSLDDPPDQQESLVELRLKYQRLTLRLKKAISVVSYLENENEKLHEMLRNEREKK